MDIKHIETFVTLARVKNFTKTAEELNYAQSTISGHIKALEDQIGSSLFDRLGKRIYLSDTGKSFLTYANRILDLYNEAFEHLRIKEDPDGTLIIGAPESLSVYRLPELIRLYRNKYPKVKIIVKLDSCCNLYKMLADHRIDMAFLIDSIPKNNQVKYYTLQKERFHLFAHTNHKLNQLHKISPAHLSEYPLILVEESDCTYNNALLNYLEKKDITPKDIEKYGSIEMVKQYTSNSEGIGFLPEMVISKDILDGNVITLDYTEPIELSVLLAYHKDKRITLEMQKIIELAEDFFDTSNTKI